MVACAAQFLVGVDGLGVAIALPSLQEDLDVRPIEGQWVLTSYGLTFGGGLLLGGRLGDLYGRRRLLTCGMILFAAGCVLAATAPVLLVVVAGRALQGVGAAASVPAALALIGSLFPAGPARTKALSVLAATTSVGVISGLLVGGVLTDLAGWRWVFALTAPLALAAAAAAPRVLPEARADGPATRPDVIGATLVTGGLTAGLFGLTRVEHRGLTAPDVLGPAGAGLVLLATFVWWARRARAPLIRPDLLRARSLRAAILGVGANAIAFTSVVYIGTLYLQVGLGYRPIEAGLALLPVDVIALIVPLLVAGRLARRSPRVLLAASFALTAAGLLWLARAPDPANYVADVMVPLMVLGASLSIAFVVLTQESLAEVPRDDRGAAAGTFETSNHLFGGAVGVALYATVLATTGQGYRAAFLAAAVVTAGLGTIAVLQARGRTRA
jgi:MFS family permease